MKIERFKGLKKLNTMRIASVADYYAEPVSVKDLEYAVEYSNSEGLKMFVMGNCSNTLFAKDYYKNVLFLNMSGFNRISYLEKDKIIKCGAGVKTSGFLRYCIEKEVSGFEFLAGIPGSIGGMVKMNAGAFGKEIGSFVKKIEIFNGEKGVVEELSRHKLFFSYRNLKINKKFILINVFFKSFHEKRDIIKESIREKIKLRRRKQPRGFSLGSIFKNGKDFFAGELIEKAGLKGLSVGDAYISEKHGNFILNRGKATGSDVVKLVQRIEKKIFQKFNVFLEREIEILF